MIELTHTIHHTTFPDLLKDVEPLIEKVAEATGVDHADLIFSGFEELSDLEEIDRHKLADVSAEQAYLDYFYENDDFRTGREYLNNHQILVDTYLSRLEDRYPDPDRRIKQLARQLINAESESRQEKIRRTIERVTDTREEVLRKREAGFRFIDRRLRETPFMPVYYGGDVNCMRDSDPENNPLAYATAEYTEHGYLACYSRPLLKTAGVEINWLDEKTPREDRQLFMVGDHRMMAAGQIALVRVFDGAIRETIQPSMGYLPHIRQL